MKLLLVENDQHLGNVIKQDLVKTGFTVDLALEKKSGESMGSTESYDMILLDVGLPNLGLDIVKTWQKKEWFTPVLLFASRDIGCSSTDFKTNTKDCLDSPFHIQELLARLNAIIRRSKEEGSPTHIESSGLYLDENNKTITNDNVVHDLTPIEYMLLRLFLLNPNKLFTKSKLIESLYELDFDPNSNVLEVYISRLRQKIGKQRIVTRRNQGYLFKNGV